MKLQKKELTKTLKVTVNTHTRLVKLAKSKVEVFDDIIERIATIAESFAKIRAKIADLYRMELNHCSGNEERTKALEKDRDEFMEFLKKLEQ